MNTTLTLQEILKEYGYTKLPKGTTEQQWFDYHERALKHEERIEREMPQKEDMEFNSSENGFDEQKYNAAHSEWQMMSSCDAPNQPGYYRANND